LRNVQSGTHNRQDCPGLSPVIFKMAVENKTPEQIMLDTINSERYAPIKIS